MLLDGKAFAKKIRSDLTTRIRTFSARTGVIPGLATLLVGDNAASKVYVGSKVKTCGEVGIHSRKIELSADLAEGSLIKEIEALNRDPAIHGILVQLPLPKQIRPERILDAVDPSKDVDGFHVINAGRLATGQPGFVPCTPLGIVRLLEEYKVPIEGKRAVVVGRSNIVGKPVAQLLLNRHATVTICHSRTIDLPAVCREADILIAAIGKAEVVRGDWIQPGAAVVDVGINRNPDGTLTGDVKFSEASERAGWLTPVPGGVGPLTIAMLLSNTLEAAEKWMERK
ncbi:MAG: bifunctional methylenetetrahydrofolate dehydrogenase/methenyltetrahydrofolate cyclohydrolase FolD [Pseudomonadota bacterium]